MNDLLDWIRNMDIEMIILLSISVITIIVLILNLIKSNKTYSAIVKNSVVVKEDLLLKDNTYSTRVTVTNIGYVSTIIQEVGYIYKDIKLPISTELINLNARESYNTVIETPKLREFILDDNQKIVKFYAYTIDSINRVSKHKMKLTYKHIKKQIKAELKADKLRIKNEKRDAKRIAKEEKRRKKLETKEIRFEHGNYNFTDRVKMFGEILFSPFKKLGVIISKKMNRLYRKREIKKDVKKRLKAEKDAKYRLEQQQKEADIKRKFEEKMAAKYDTKANDEEEKTIDSDEVLEQETDSDDIEINDVEIDNKEL